MKRARQLGFEILERNNMKLFGGSYLKGNPKEKRPISIKRSMHMVMRSLLARGSKSLLKFEDEIIEIIHKQGRKLGVKVYRIANAGNHIHLMILPRSRPAFNAFVRSITGLIARKVLGAEKGHAKNQEFWEKRPFTRIVEWGSDYKRAYQYLVQNSLEALGFIPHQPRNYKFTESTA